MCPHNCVQYTLHKAFVWAIKKHPSNKETNGTKQTNVQGKIQCLFTEKVAGLQGSNIARSESELLILGRHLEVSLRVLSNGGLMDS